jgi:hypothetical protein
VVLVDPAISLGEIPVETIYSMGYDFYLWVTSVDPCNLIIDRSTLFAFIFIAFYLTKKRTV